MHESELAEEALHAAPRGRRWARRQRGATRGDHNHDVLCTGRDHSPAVLPQQSLHSLMVDPIAQSFPQFQIVTSPRLLRPRSYSLQFRILYFVLYWRLIRLDFPAAMTLPP